MFERELGTSRVYFDTSDILDGKSMIFRLRCLDLGKLHLQIIYSCLYVPFGYKNYKLDMHDLSAQSDKPLP